MRINASPAADIGAVCQLMLQSPRHRHFLLSDIEWLVLPPLSLGQLRVFTAGDNVVGYASWAYLSDEVAKRFVSASFPRLAIYEWASGTQPWIIDVIAAVDHLQAIKNELKSTVFKGKAVFTLGPRIVDGNVVGQRPEEF